MLLTGGSAPGLGAAAGVSTLSSRERIRLRTPYARVPLVSAAVIYDLGLGKSARFPGRTTPTGGGLGAGPRWRKARSGPARGDGGQDPAERRA